MPRARNNEHGVIFEFISIGAYVKVSAIDTRTGTKVSIVGDPRRGEVALRRVAMRKLERALEKNAPAGQRGRLVQPALTSNRWSSSRAIWFTRSISQAR